uniref:Uncharacterized protein n=1 Tax=Knipowitschia caucasica TaxID=637954 RepID=A0AAV2KI23_KNICA
MCWNRRTIRSTPDRIWDDTTQQQQEELCEKKNTKACDPCEHPAKLSSQLGGVDRDLFTVWALEPPQPLPPPQSRLDSCRRKHQLLENMSTSIK